MLVSFNTANTFIHPSLNHSGAYWSIIAIFCEAETGGTALKDVFENVQQRHACPNLHFYRSHERTERQWQQRGFHTIVVLREPVDRFRSAFDYAAFGSEKYQSNRDWRLARVFGNASSFARSLSLKRPHTSETAPAIADPTPSSIAWDVLKHREHGVQFRPAARWVDGDPRRRSVVCYDPQFGATTEELGHSNASRSSESSELAVAVAAIVEKGLQRAPSSTAQRAELSNEKGQRVGPVQGTCRINAKPRNVSKKRSRTLDADGAAWVRSYYNMDVALYAKYCLLVPES